MLTNLSVDQILTKASSHIKKNEFSDAKKLYKTVLIQFPKNKRAQEGLENIKKCENDRFDNPPKETIDQLINLYNQRKLPIMVDQTQSLLKQYPKSFIMWNFLGVAYIDLGRASDATKALKKATELNPQYASGFCNLSVALQNEGKLDEALDACKKTIKLKPDFADAYFNMGNILKDQDKIDDAIEAYKNVILINPNYMKVYNNLGVCYYNLQNYDQAIVQYKKSLSLNCVSEEVYSNIGTSLKCLDKFDQALVSYKKAISVKPDYAEAHQALSFVLLYQGKLKEGFEEYEWRWKTPKNLGKQRCFRQPLWDGKTSLNDKTILIWYEQGVGDTIMWSSRLSLIASQAKQCILECQPKLLPLLKRSFPDIDIRAVNKSFDMERDDFDFHLPMGNLYKHFIKEISENTRPDAYLVPELTRVKYWKKRLQSLGKGPYIGISWKSANISRTRLQNYASVSELSPILKIPNVTFVNLQYSDFKDDLGKIKSDLGVTVHNFDDLDHFNNIDDVAALCAALDFVVSTKITVPLISAAVGTSTKIANWKQSEWNNVLLNPVGPLVDIFERNTLEPWSEVFNQIAKDISNHIENKSFIKNNAIEVAKKLNKNFLQAKQELIELKLTNLNKHKKNCTSINPPMELVSQIGTQYNQGHLNAVVENARILLKQYPKSFMIWNLLGASASQLGMLDKALEAYQEAIKLKPDFADAYCNMSVIFQNQGKLKEAIEACNKAISLKPNYAVAFNNRGNALKDQGKIKEAIKDYKNALAIKADYADAYYNMALAYNDESKFNETVKYYQKAITLNPSHSLAYINMGNAFKNLGALEKAIESYKKAISVKPDNAEAHQNLSYVLLNQGKLKEGLNEYEWRLKTKIGLASSRHFTQPLWDGKQSLKNKKILLWSEQGIGDTIIWSSLIPFVSLQAKSCILECQEKLVPLLERSFPSIEVKPENRHLDLERKDFDFHLPMGSLYRCFLQEILKIQKPKPFLLPDPVRVKFWKKRLNLLGNGPFIGISWKSSDMSTIRIPNYSSISEWSSILTIPDVTFINLQSKDFEDELKQIEDEFGVKVHNFDDLDQFNNIDDVAALCSALDMVVSIQSSVPLISAGVGTSTKLASWSQSSWNNILHKPVGPLVDKFKRNTWEPWDNVFNLITDNILKMTKDRDK